MGCVFQLLFMPSNLSVFDVRHSAFFFSFGAGYVLLHINSLKPLNLDVVMLIENRFSLQGPAFDVSLKGL